MLALARKKWTGNPDKGWSYWQAADHPNGTVSPSTPPGYTPSSWSPPVYGTHYAETRHLNEPHVATWSSPRRSAMLIPMSRVRFPRPLK